jgi:hypothetical protein
MSQQFDGARRAVVVLTALRRKAMLGLLVAVLMTAAFLPAAASPPEPVDYRIVQNGSCWLPDGSTLPHMVVTMKQDFYWETPLRLVAFCRGNLPKDAEWPRQRLILDYSSTGRLCRVVMGQVTYVTTDYAAAVSPNGITAITCRITMD